MRTPLPFLAFVLFTLGAWSAACSPTRPPVAQRRPWTTDAQAALVVTAHVVDAADAFAAQRYTVETQAPGATLNSVELRYARIATARRLARPALMGAQSAVAVLAQLVRDHADTTITATAACQALAAIRAASTTITQLANALSEAGLRDAPSFANAVNAVTAVLSSGPVCPPGAP